MYVCMYACMYVCIYVCIVYTYVCMYVCTKNRMFTCWNFSISGNSSFINTFICKSFWQEMDIQMVYVRMYVCMYVCMYLSMYVCMYVCIWIPSDDPLSTSACEAVSMVLISLWVLLVMVSLRRELMMLRLFTISERRPRARKDWVKEGHLHINYSMYGSNSSSRRLHNKLRQKGRW